MLSGAMGGGAPPPPPGGAGMDGAPKANVTIIDASRSLYGPQSGGLASQLKQSMQNP